MHARCLALLLVLPAVPAAGQDRPEDWPEGSAMHTGLLARRELEAADRHLNRVYRRLLRQLPADEPDHHPRRALVEAQRAWIRFRDAECALAGETEGGIRMWKSAQDIACQARMTRERVERLERLLEHSDPS